MVKRQGEHVLWLMLMAVPGGKCKIRGLLPMFLDRELKSCFRLCVVSLTLK